MITGITVLHRSHVDVKAISIWRNFHLPIWHFKHENIFCSLNFLWPFWHTTWEFVRISKACHVIDIEISRWNCEHDKLESRNYFGFFDELYMSHVAVFINSHVTFLTNLHVVCHFSLQTRSMLHIAWRSCPSRNSIHFTILVAQNLSNACDI